MHNGDAHGRRDQPPEIDAVPRPEVDPVFEHAFANRFDVGEVTLLQPNKSSRDPGARNRLQFHAQRSRAASHATTTEILLSCQSPGRRFPTGPSKINGLSQTTNLGVGSSNLSGPATHKDFL